MDETEDTLVIYISDNGAPLRPQAYVGSLNDPMAGEKGTLLDGGIRVPYLMAWPGTLPAGEVFEPMVSSLDATATALAVADAPTDARVEGKNLIPYLLGEKPGPVHDALFWRWRGQAAVRAGDWKFLRLGDEERYLFDLSRPSLEKAAFNRIAAEPEIAEELEARLLEHTQQWKTSGLPTDVHPGDRIFFDAHLGGELGAKDTETKPATPRAAPARTEPAPQASPDDAFQGWILRLGDGALEEEGLVLRPQRPGRTAMFLTLNRLRLAPPVRVEVYGRSGSPVDLVMTWRTSESGTDFLTVPGARLEFPAGEHGASALIEADAPVIHLRIVFPKDYAGPFVLKSIRLSDDSGDLEFLFHQAKP